MATAITRQAMNRALPAELLEEVIFNSLPHPPGSDYPARLAQLSEVSDHWESIVEGCPRLWSEIDSSYRPSVLHKFLVHSKGYPLHIYCKSDLEADHLASFAAGIGFHSSRWQTLELAIPENQFYSIACGHLFSDELPNLRVLEIDLCRGSNIISVPALNLPKVNTLRLVSAQLEPSSSIIARLQTLEVAGTRTTEFDVKNFIDVLSGARDLQRLSVRSITLYRHSVVAAEATRRVSLPRLKTLILEWVPHSMVAHVLASIDIPRCEKLRIICQPQRNVRTTECLLQRLVSQLPPLLLGTTDTASKMTLAVDRLRFSLRIAGNNDSRSAFFSISGLASDAVLDRIVDELQAHPTVLDLPTTIMSTYPHSLRAEGTLFVCLARLRNVTSIHIRARGWARPMIGLLAQTPTNAAGIHQWPWPRLIHLDLPLGPLTIEEFLDMVESRYRRGKGKAAGEQAIPAPFESLRVHCIGTEAAGMDAWSEITALVGEGKVRVGWDYSRPPVFLADESKAPTPGDT